MHVIEWLLGKRALNRPRSLTRQSQTISGLREAKGLVNQRDSIGEASRKTGVTEQIYYHWRRECDGCMSSRPNNPRSWGRRPLLLIKLVSNPSLDNAILKKPWREPSNPVTEDV